MAQRSLNPTVHENGHRSPGMYNPFGRLRDEMDRLFEDFGRHWLADAHLGGDFLKPDMDVSESDKGLLVTADLPGVDQKDIDVELLDNVLTIRAERRAEREEKDEKRQFHMIERSSGAFMRQFALPFEAEDNRIEASFDNGVLRIEIPRSKKAAQARKKIAIGRKK